MQINPGAPWIVQCSCHNSGISSSKTNAGKFITGVWGLLQARMRILAECSTMGGALASISDCYAGGRARTKRISFGFRISGFPDFPEVRVFTFFRVFPCREINCFLVLVFITNFDQFFLKFFTREARKKLVVLWCFWVHFEVHARGNNSETVYALFS